VELSNGLVLERFARYRFDHDALTTVNAEKNFTGLWFETLLPWPVFNRTNKKQDS